MEKEPAGSRTQQLPRLQKDDVACLDLEAMAHRQHDAIAKRRARLLLHTPEPVVLRAAYSSLARVLAGTEPLFGADLGPWDD
jgi:hypothetical protein